jgi:hypothetical protein
MAFGWAQNISVGASIDKLDIDEIRTNIDYVDSNVLYCTAHYGTYNATDQLTNNTGHYSTNQASDHLTYQASNLTGNFNPHCSGDFGGHQVYCDAHDSNVNDD